MKKEIYGCRSKAVTDDQHQRIRHRTLGNATSDWKQTSLKVFFFHFSPNSSKCSKTENGYFFLCSPLLNVDQHEARKKKIRPAAKDTHPEPSWTNQRDWAAWVFWRVSERVGRTGWPAGVTAGYLVPAGLRGGHETLSSRSKNKRKEDHHLKKKQKK